MAQKFGLLHALLAAAGLSGAQDEPARQRLDAASTRLLVAGYKAADHWSIKALTLRALGQDYAGAAAEILKDALDGKDERLRAFALETLLRSTDITLRRVVTRELLDGLVTIHVKDPHPYFAGRVVALLQRMAPEAKDDWQAWWATAKSGYSPQPEPEEAPVGVAGSTVAEKLSGRLSDLKESGLDVVLCIDATSSMQPSIDATREGLSEILVLLKGIAPKLRVGLVNYRDYADHEQGAAVQVPLTDKSEHVEESLRKLRAWGGGSDTPEQVERGLEFALSPSRMGWSKTANKVLILVGDAPPHPQHEKLCVMLSKQGLENPFGKGSAVATPSSSVTPRPRPIVTSAIAVGPGGNVHPDAERTFREIAQAGGGTYGVLSAPIPPGLDKSVEQALRASAKPDSTWKVAAHLLTLAFGVEWESHVADVVLIYSEYRQQKYFK